MPVYGMRPEDVVVDAAGNVQTGATLTLHATQADAQAGSSALASVTTSAGRWSADVAAAPVWVRTPNGAVYEIADFSAKADKTYVDTQLSGKLDQATANSTYVARVEAASYTYNPDGTVASETVAGKTTSYTYNTDGTVATVSRDGVTLTYTYNPDGTVAGVA